MSLNQRLQTALAIVFILAGALRVTAQTQTAVNSSSTSEPKKAEPARPSIVISENTNLEKTCEISRDRDDIWHIRTDLTLNAGVQPAARLVNSRSWADGVVGLRGKAALTEKVFFVGRFDVGGGGSKFTYQLFGGLGYNLNKKIALVAGYRVLDVNYNKNNFFSTCRSADQSWVWDSGSNGFYLSRFRFRRSVLPCES